MSILNCRCGDTAPHNPVQAELLFQKIRTYSGLPDCFAHLERGSLRKDIYVWKSVGGFNLRAYVTYPPAHRQGTQLPVVAFFHGGGWAYGNPTYWLAPAHYFASRGTIAVTFQYRIGTVHNSTIADSTEDARDAMAWLRLNASALDINPDRIVTCGNSAGGHLALMAMLDGGAFATAAFHPVVLQPVFSPLLTMRDEDTPMNALNKNTAKPTLIIHGTADAHLSTPFRASKAYCDVADYYSNSCTLMAIEDAPHNFLMQNDYYIIGIAAMDRWLSKILGHPLEEPAYSNVEKWVAISRWHCRSLDCHYNWSASHGYTKSTKGRW
jgi:acetyl esterase